jgi:7-cyano-7-deazaguanine reductase
MKNLKETCSLLKSDKVKLQKVNTYMNREWLENEYIFKAKSSMQIAKELEVSVSAIDNWRRKLNIISNYKYKQLSEVYGKDVAENCKRVRSIIYSVSNKEKADRCFTGKSKAEIYGISQSKKINKKISGTLSKKGNYEKRFGKEKADIMKEKLSKSKRGFKNPMYTGYDKRMLKKVGKIALYFCFKAVLKNNFRCVHNCSSTDVSGHHRIRQGTILNFLERLYPEKYKNENWVMSKYAEIHEKLADFFVLSLCASCHSKVKKGHKDILDEKDLIQKLNFENEIKKIVENSESALGKKTSYIDTYNPLLLFPISRQDSRNRIGEFNFIIKGLDIWNAYEFSFLDETGKPQNHILQIAYSCNSFNIVESKSLKLYLNSFNQYKFTLIQALDRIRNDLQALLQIKDIFNINIRSVDTIENRSLNSFESVDTILSTDFEYNYNPFLLKSVQIENVSDNFIYLYSNLLKSNCRHTKQPDWGTVYISYLPNIKILEKESFLKYIVSYRSHNEFHEECCERILLDLVNLLQPKCLKVCCKYVRRGGIDINPIRIYDPDNLLNYAFEQELIEFIKTDRQ